MQLSTDVRNAALTNLVTVLGTTAFLIIYTGSPPANCAAGATGTQIVACPLSNPIGTVSAGVLTFSAVTPATTTPASATGGYYRLCTDATGATCKAQGTVGVSGAELNFPGGATWISGTAIDVTGFTITAPGA